MAVTVVNLTPTRAFNARGVSMNTLADALGTLIDDVEGGTYLGSQWAITNGATDRVIDAGSHSVNEIADVVSTFVADNQGAALNFDIDVLNTAPIAVLDCDAVTTRQLVDALGSFVLASAPTHVTGGVTLGALVSGDGSIDALVGGEVVLA